MFSLISPRRKGVLIKNPLPLFLTLCFVVTLFSGCNTGDDKPGLLEGAWSDPRFQDAYTINEGTLSYDGAEFEGYPSMDMAGEIVRHSDFSASAGIIYVKYTSPDSLAGNYIAVYWKELTESKVELAIAINTVDFSNPAVGTVDEALEKFTMDNIDAWIGSWGGPYIKQ
jgi:hypothetical protein